MGSLHGKLFFEFAASKHSKDAKNLVSEASGWTQMIHGENPKHEYRNPKQIPNSNA